MTVSFIRQPRGLCEPVGLYSNLSVASGQELIAVAGQVALDADGHLVGEGEVEAQVRQAFENVALALAAVGASCQDVVKTTTYLVDPAHIPLFVQSRKQVFMELYPAGEYPPNTLVVVNRLIDERFLVEIEALAVRGGDRAS